VTTRPQGKEGGWEVRVSCNPCLCAKGFFDREKETQRVCFFVCVFFFVCVCVQFEEQDPQLMKHLEEVKSLQQEIEKSLVPKKPVGIFAAYASE